MVSNMTAESVMISGFTVIISAFVALVVTLLQNQVAQRKIYSEFSGKLYSLRLNAYLEMFELISRFIKKACDHRISYAELDHFYENYSNQDSKWSLLFSSRMVQSSHDLILEMRRMLGQYKPDDTIDVRDLRENFLTKVELAMKYEIGAFAFDAPGSFGYSQYAQTYIDTIKSRLEQNN